MVRWHVLCAGGGPAPALHTNLIRIPVIAHKFEHGFFSKLNCAIRFDMFYVQLLFDVFASIVSPQVQNIDNSVLTVVSP